MVIQPNTTIYICNTPLMYGSEDTILFNSINDQYLYFYNAALLKVYKYTYQREHRNYIRIEDPQGILDNCNYIMFVNENYENKRYYAFILNVNWINNEVAEIQYEVDYIQTFLFSLYNKGTNTNLLPYCFIERQHQSTDAIGDNIITESVAVGEYEYNNSYTKLVDLSTGLVILGESNIHGYTYDNVYSGVKMYAYDPTLSQDRIALESMIDSHTTDDDILFIYMVPKAIIDAMYQVDSNHVIVSKGQNAYAVTRPGPNITTTATLNGYSPKNNKLYTYPYNYAIISDGNGNNIKLRFEFFDNIGTSYITTEYAVTPPAMIKVRPITYKKASEYREEMLTISGFPMVSWSYSAFKRWISSSLVSNVIQVAASAVGAAVAYKIGLPNIGRELVPLTPDPNGIKGFDATNLINYKQKAQQMGAVAGASTIGNILSQGYASIMEGNISNGTFTNSGSDLAIGKLGVYAARVSIDAQTAKSIDDYFTMYGYAQNVVEKPELYARSHFTYVKTNGITITSEMPNEAKISIAERFNNGIRFWLTPAEVGNYSVTNNPRY